MHAKTCIHIHVCPTSQALEMDVIGGDAQPGLVPLNQQWWNVVDKIRMVNLTQAILPNRIKTVHDLSLERVLFIHIPGRLDAPLLRRIKVTNMPSTNKTKTRDVRIQPLPSLSSPLATQPGQEVSQNTTSSQSSTSQSSTLTLSTSTSTSTSPSPANTRTPKLKLMQGIEFENPAEWHTEMAYGNSVTFARV